MVLGLGTRFDRAYDLDLEEGSPFSQHWGGGRKTLPLPLARVMVA
jgi:hypothetical protein